MVAMVMTCRFGPEHVGSGAKQFVGHCEPHQWPLGFVPDRWVQFAEFVLDAVDQVAQLGDFLGCWCGLRLGPVLDVSGGHDPFPVGQELLEVGLQFWKVGGVAAEVAAAHAGVLVRAGLAAGFDVGGFGADAEWHGDLADAEPGVFFPDQVVDLQEYPASLPVELLQGNLFDGAAHTDFG